METTGLPLTSLQQRIKESVTEDPDTGCWIWNRQISNSGYGKIMVRDPDGNRYLSAHHASYCAFVAPIPVQLIVRQTCGNRLCVNPKHLVK